MEPRIIVYESAATADPPLRSLLPDCGCRPVGVDSAEALLDEVTHGLPRLVIFSLAPGAQDDLVALRLLRRVAPDLPLVIVASEASLEVRRLIQTLRPVYFAVLPLDPEEIREVILASCPDPRKAQAAATAVRPERQSRRTPADRPPRSTPGATPN